MATRAKSWVVVELGLVLVVEVEEEEEELEGEEEGEEEGVADVLAAGVVEEEGAPVS